MCLLSTAPRADRLGCGADRRLTALRCYDLRRDTVCSGLSPLLAFAAVSRYPWGYGDNPRRVRYEEAQQMRPDETA